jgi:hypothetical protein
MNRSFAEQFEDDFEGGSVTPEGLAKAAAAGAAQIAMHIEKCPKCRGTGRFISWGGRDLGACHSCKGKGQKVFKSSATQRADSRAKAADRKANAAQTALETFAAQHPAEWAWIEASRGSFDFAQSMYTSIQGYGSLTVNQLAACTRAAEKAAARNAERAAQRTAAIENAPVIDMTKIEAAFAAARASGLKSPKLRIAGLVISPAKATSANAGALYVKSKGSFDDSTYFGKIIGGKFIKSRECDAATEAQILVVAADPLAAAIAYGRETGTCSCCGRELTNKISIELGIGPICREQWGM